jgi:hypothetical protein
MLTKGPDGDCRILGKEMMMTWTTMLSIKRKREREVDKDCCPKLEIRAK